MDLFPHSSYLVYYYLSPAQSPIHSIKTERFNALKDARSEMEFKVVEKRIRKALKSKLSQQLYASYHQVNKFASFRNLHENGKDRSQSQKQPKNHFNH